MLTQDYVRIIPILRPQEEVKSRADIVDRWLHDCYVDSEQGPREQWEKDRVRLYCHWVPCHVFAMLVLGA